MRQRPRAAAVGRRAARAAVEASGRGAAARGGSRSSASKYSRTYVRVQADSDELGTANGDQIKAEEGGIRRRSSPRSRGRGRGGWGRSGSSESTTAAVGAGCRRRDRWRRIGAAPLYLTLWMDEVVGGDPPGLVVAANCGQWPWGSRRRGVGRGRPVAGRGSDVRSAEAEGVRGFQARGVSPLYVRRREGW